MSKIDHLNNNIDIFTNEAKDDNKCKEKEIENEEFKF